MGLIKAGMGALGGTFADQWKEIITVQAFDEHTAVSPGIVQESNNGRNFSTVNRCQRRYSLQKDKNVSPDVQRTPKEMTILSRTALELL